MNTVAPLKQSHPAVPSPERKRIKAVHLLHTIAYGGVETILINWVKKLREFRECPIDLSMVCFANPNQSENAFIEAARRENIPVRTIPWSRRKPVLSSGRKLAEILRAERADILHTHNTYADLTGLVAARLTGVKTVSSLYVWSDFGWKRNALQWINQQALRWFDSVTAQCRCTLQDTCARGIDQRKVQILPSGFELSRKHLSAEERSQQRRALGAADDDVVLVNAARLYPEKAQAKLIEVFRDLIASEPKLKLWILGVGPLDAELRAQVAALNLTDHVRFLGFCADLDGVLKLADIQVHPSFAEGIPMSILAGMGAGLPIVASDVGGIPEVIATGRSGVLVPAAGGAGFDKEFGGAVLKLVRERDHRVQLGKGAADFIATEYSMEAALGKLERLYRSLLTK